MLRPRSPVPSIGLWLENLAGLHLSRLMTLSTDDTIISRIALVKDIGPAI